MLFIMGLSWGGVVYPWQSSHVIATIVVGFLALVAFVLWDAYAHHGDPLLPIHLFKTRGYLAMVRQGRPCSRNALAYNHLSRCSQQWLAHASTIQ